MNEEKLYHLCGQNKDFRLVDSFVGFAPEGFSGWDDWDNIIGPKKYPCHLTLIKEEKKVEIFLRVMIEKEALPMSIYGEERADDWHHFAICSLSEKLDEEFIIPLYPY